MFGKKTPKTAPPIHYRQGDVLLEKIHDTDAISTQVIEASIFGPVPLDRGRVVLAYGEVTGHAHAIDVKDRPKDDVVLFDNGKGVRILKVESEADLVHEEHATIRLPKGYYRQIQQREWDDNQERLVAD